MFWVELPEQRRLCPNFIKLRTPDYLWILLVLSWCKWLLVCNVVPGGIWVVIFTNISTILSYPSWMNQHNRSVILSYQSLKIVLQYCFPYQKCFKLFNSPKTTRTKRSSGSTKGSRAVCFTIQFEALIKLESRPIYC